VRRFHAAKFLPPGVERRSAHTMTTADVVHLRPSLILLQHRDDLLVADPAALHRIVLLHPFKGEKSQLANGSTLGGRVTISASQSWRRVAMQYWPPWSTGPVVH